MFEKLDSVLLHFEDIERELQSPDIAANQARFKKLMKEQSDLVPIVNAYREYKDCRAAEQEALQLLEDESDEEMRELAKEELIKKAQEVADAGQWKVGSVKMKELMDSWKKLGFAGPEVNDQVWEAFQAARQTFYDRQRAWYEELDKKHAEAKEKKKAIIEEAREVTADRC